MPRPERTSPAGSSQCASPRSPWAPTRGWNRALTASIVSALFQPLVGAHGDRGEAHWLLPAGLVLSGLGIGAVGFATSYPLTLLAVAVCSAGVAAYHPEGCLLY